MWTLVAGLILSSCSSSVAISEAGATGDGSHVFLGLNSCGGTYDVEVEETPDAVTVTVTDQRSPIRLGGDDCQDGWTLDLKAPLGDRELIDGGRNVTLEVVYEPWNQWRFGEADYRSALEAAAACIVAGDPEAEVAVLDGPDGPRLDIQVEDLPDGASRVDPAADCMSVHVDSLRR